MGHQRLQSLMVALKLIAICVAVVYYKWACVGGNLNDDLLSWNDCRNYLIHDEEIDLMMLTFLPLGPSFPRRLSLLS